MGSSKTGRPFAFVAFFIAAAVPAAVSCDRAESDRNVTTAVVPDPPAAREPTPTSNAAQPPCVVPLGEVSAPEARPAERCPSDPDGPPVMPRGAVSFPDAPGAPRIEVEVARTSAHRAHGLMYRTDLPEDAGMIFSWPEESVRSFWMRNTCLPLDMLFIAKDGTIVGVLEQVPTLNDEPRGVPCRAAHVLEVNAGWTRAHGVMPGQRVAMDT